MGFWPFKLLLLALTGFYAAWPVLPLDDLNPTDIPQTADLRTPSRFLHGRRLSGSPNLKLSGPDRARDVQAKSHRGSGRAMIFHRLETPNAVKKR